MTNNISSQQTKPESIKRMNKKSHSFSSQQTQVETVFKKWKHLGAELMNFSEDDYYQIIIKKQFR